MDPSGNITGTSNQQTTNILPATQASSIPSTVITPTTLASGDTAAAVSSTSSTAATSGIASAATSDTSTIQHLQQYKVPPEQLTCGEYEYILTFKHGLRLVKTKKPTPSQIQENNQYILELDTLDKLVTALTCTSGGIVRINNNAPITQSQFDQWRLNQKDRFKLYMSDKVYPARIDFGINDDRSIIIVLVKKAPEFVITRTHLLTRGCGHNEIVGHNDGVQMLLSQPVRSSHEIALKQSYNYGDPFHCLEESKHIEFKYFEDQTSAKKLVQAFTAKKNSGLLFGLGSTEGGGNAILGIYEDKKKTDTASGGRTSPQLVVKGQCLPPKDRQLFEIELERYLTRDCRIWGLEGYTPKKGKHWDIEFIPVLNGPVPCKPKCQDCSHKDRVVISINIHQCAGGVFAKQPESYMIDDNGDIDEVSFESWKNEHIQSSQHTPQPPPAIQPTSQPPSSQPTSQPPAGQHTQQPPPAIQPTSQPPQVSQLISPQPTSQPTSLQSLRQPTTSKKKWLSVKMNSKEWKTRNDDQKMHLQKSVTIPEDIDISEFELFEMKEPINFTPSRSTLIMNTPHMQRVCDLLEEDMGEAFAITSPNLFKCFNNKVVVPRSPYLVMDILSLNTAGIIRLCCVYAKEGSPSDKRKQVTDGRILARIIKKCILLIMPHKKYQHLNIHIPVRVYRFEGTDCDKPSPRIVQKFFGSNESDVDMIKSGIARLLLLNKEGSLFDAVGEEFTIHYSPHQIAATLSCLEYPISIITGAPGTGKSLVIQELCRKNGKDKSLYFCLTQALAKRAGYKNKIDALYVETCQDIVDHLGDQRYKDRTLIAIDDAQTLSWTESSLSTLCELLTGKCLTVALDSMFHNYKDDDQGEKLKQFLIHKSSQLHGIEPYQKTLLQIFRNSEVVTHYMKSGFKEEPIKQKSMVSQALVKGDDVKVIPIDNMYSVNEINGVLRHVNDLCTNYKPEDIAVLIHRGTHTEPMAKIMLALFNKYLHHTNPHEATYPATGVTISSLDNFMGMDSQVVVFPVWKGSEDIHNIKWRCAMTSRAIQRLDFIQPTVDHTQAEVHGLDHQVLADYDEGLPELGAHSTMSMACAMGQVDIIKDLLDEGEDVNPDDVTAIPLSAAVVAGQLEAVEFLLSKGADVSAADGYDRTPLHLACQNGHDQVVDRLLKEEAVPSAVDRRGCTPLHLACDKGHHQVAEMLLVKGADHSAIDKFGCKPLHIACTKQLLEVAKILLEKGADHSAVNPSGFTPLHLACGHEDPRVAKLLLDEGADISAVDLEGRTPLHLAWEKGHLQVAEMLLVEGADHSAIYIFGCKSLHVACTKQLLEVAKILLEKGADIYAVDSEGRTPLHLACEKGHLQVSEMLLDKGAGVSAADGYDRTPLHLACQNGHDQVVDRLLKEGADHSAIDIFGCKPLHIACTKQLLEVAKILLEKGADHSAVDPSGCTPLHLACGHEDPRVAKLLLDEGADISAMDPEGCTPLHLSCEKGHLQVAEMLLDKGADFSAVDRRGHTPLHLACDKGHHQVAEMLLVKGADHSAIDIFGCKPLHIACTKQLLEVAKILLDKGADHSAVDLSGCTPLHLACGHEDPRVAKLLLDEGADIYAVDSECRTPLHLACEKGHLQVSEMLLDKGADTNAHDDVGNTPFDLAEQSSHITGPEAWHAAQRESCRDVVKFMTLRTANQITLMYYFVKSTIPTDAPV